MQSLYLNRSASDFPALFADFHQQCRSLIDTRIEYMTQRWKDADRKEPCSTLFDAMSYSLLAGGKRLRPTMVMTVAATIVSPFYRANKTVDAPPATKQALSKNADDFSDDKTKFQTKNFVETYLDQRFDEDTIKLALALEMLHTYSLIHDDLPAMDDDKLRRGQPTCHVKFGEDIAILAGDALQSEAVSLILDISRNNSDRQSGKIFQSSELKPDMPLSSQSILATLQKVMHAAGSKGMVEGQAIDVAGTATTKQSLRTMYSLKTGALINASLCAPLLLYRLDTLIPAMERFAASLGLLYQVTDDILDATTSSEILGKDSGSDARNNKTTFYSLLGDKGSREYAKNLFDSCYQSVAEIENLIEGLANRLDKGKMGGVSDKENVSLKKDIGNQHLNVLRGLCQHVYSRTH